MKSLKKVEYMARKAIESMYIGVCDIVEYQSVTDSESKITRQSEVTVQSGVPCRLSYSKYNNMYPAIASDTVSTVSQKIKLFVAPEININSGSKIIVTQNGRETAFKSSGAASFYSSHQEIPLELFRGWT